VSRFALRVANAAGAHRNSPACGGLKQADALLPSASTMLGAEQRDEIESPVKRLSQCRVYMLGIESK
jgi:hypothetical protein